MASPYEDAINTLGQMDQRLANWQNVEEPSPMTLPSEYNPTHPGLGLTESPTTGGAMEQGLGLAQRGLEAITPSRDTLYKFAQGLEAAGAVGRGATPLYLQQQHQDLQRQQLADAAQERKQMMAFRIQQQEEQQRHNKWDEALGIVSNEKLSPAQRMGILKERAKTDPISAQLAHGLNEKTIGRFGTVKEFMPQPIAFYEKGLKDGTLNIDSITSDMDIAEETQQAVMKAKTPSLVMQNLQRLSEQDPNNPHIKAALATMQTEQSAKQANARVDIGTEAARIKKANQEANKVDVGPSPPRNDALDFPSMAVSGLPFASIPRDAVVTPEHIARAKSSGFDTSQIQLGMPLQSGLLKIGLQQSGKLAEQTQFSGGMGRGDVPVGVESNLYTKLLPDGTAQAIHDPGMGKIEAGKQGYRDTARFKENLDRADKAKTAIRMLGDLERYAKEIVTAQGGPIETTLQGWKLGLSGISKAGAMTNLTAPNGKKLTVGEVAALYDDKSNQVADQLARGGGMVGVATEQDTMRSMKGLAGRYETANMASEKFGTFKSTFGNNLLQEYDRAYGREGVPATLRSHLSKGELPTQSKLPAKQFLQQQEKAYRDQGFQDAEIRDLLKRDFRDMGY